MKQQVPGVIVCSIAKKRGKERNHQTGGRLVHDFRQSRRSPLAHRHRNFHLKFSIIK